MPKKLESKPTPTLSEQSFKRLCGHLEDAITGEKASAAFACGGTIPINATASTTSSEPLSAKTSLPVNLFWNREGDETKAYKLVLPHGDTETDRLCQLVSDCEPAGFGRGQQDVMDLEYRNAGKLDPSQFATSFHPADFGIIENIEHVLAPQLIHTEVDRDMLPSGRVEAELYKLNVYSGPSGLFRKHVDTPRSKSQIGSLVVCLPSSFNGGNLLVRHNDHEVDFDWQAQSANTIQWAAFYCDCEHEIRTISRGERITLTYNLYIVESPEIPNSSGSIDPTVYPLYQELRNILATPAFLQYGESPHYNPWTRKLMNRKTMGNLITGNFGNKTRLTFNVLGGVLGIFCSHAYAHTSEKATELLPRSLKGSDLVLYTVLKSLGIDADILPVLHNYEYEDESDSDDSSDSDGSSDEDAYYVHRGVGYKLHVGDKLKPWFDTSNDPYDPLSKIIKRNWKQRKFEKPITWLCKPTHKLSAMSFMIFGNEAMAQETYSYAAMMAFIPPWRSRLSQLNLKKAEEQSQGGNV